MTPSLSDTFEPPSTTVYGRSGVSVSLWRTFSSAEMSVPAALGRSFGRSKTLAVHHSEPVGDEDIPELGQLLREGEALVGILRGLGRGEAQVLEDGDLPVLECGDRGESLVPNRLGDEADALAEQLAEPLRDWPEAVLGGDLAVGAPEVADHDHARALVYQGVERRQRRSDPAVVGDAAVLERDVEVTADDDSPAGQ
jgi:hypothetical protein